MQRCPGKDWLSRMRRTSAVRGMADPSLQAALFISYGVFRQAQSKQVDMDALITKDGARTHLSQWA